MLLRILQWNIIGVRDPIARSTDYSDDTRLAQATSRKRHTAFQFRESGWLHWTKFRRRTHFGSQICMRCRVYAYSRVPVVKDFIVMNLIFIQTVLVVLSLFSSFPSVLALFLSSCPSNTRRTECYVPMQTWFAGYLERNKGGEHSSTAPYPGWLSVIQ